MAGDTLARDLETIGTAGTHARSAEQARVMQEAIEKKVCPFCDMQKKEYKYPIIWNNNGWTYKPNDFPYEDHDFHHVLAYKHHTNDFTTLLPEDWRDLGAFFTAGVSEFNMRGGIFAMRFGLSSHNASTVRHLHAHLQAPSMETAIRPSIKKIQESLRGRRKFFYENEWEIILTCDETWTIQRIKNPPLHYKDYFIMTHANKERSILQFFPWEWKALGKSLSWTVKHYDLPGGGITFPFGHQYFNNRFLSFPYVEIHVPDLTGRVWAEAVPGVYRCKATFAKDESPGREKERAARLK